MHHHQDDNHGRISEDLDLNGEPLGRRKSALEDPRTLAPPAGFPTLPVTRRRSNASRATTGEDGRPEDVDASVRSTLAISRIHSRDRREPQDNAFEMLSIQRPRAAKPEPESTIQEVMDNVFMTGVHIPCQRFRKTFGDLQWLISAYMLTFGGFRLLAGVLTDRYGRKLIFCTGMALISIWTLANGVATSFINWPFSALSKTTLIAQEVNMLSAGEIALRFLPMGCNGFVFSLLMSRMLEHFNTKTLLVFGMTICTIAPVPSALTNDGDIDFWKHVFLTTVIGVAGITIINCTITVVLLDSVPVNVKSLCGGMINTAF
ncbi:Fc.00g105240.m01.CDS01 [Cosmosporella sp. VM-42]